MEYDVSNIDFAIMLLLAEQPHTSGYSLDKLVEERGFRVWAGIGVSSIYARLKKLEAAAMIRGALDQAKKGRGPTRRLFCLTEAGEALLLAQVREALSSTREHDPRFNLALGGVSLVGAAQARECLSDRRVFLVNESKRLTGLAKSSTTGVAARLLFGRIIHGINAEVAWLDMVELGVALGAREIEANE